MTIWPSGFHKWRWRYVFAWTAALTVAVAFGFHTQGEQRAENCRQIELVKSQITVSLRRSLQTIPTLSYYKNHPQERERAVDQTRQTLRLFAPRDC